MKRKHSTRFPSKLARDPLRWAIATVLLAPAGVSAQGIVPQAGPGGTPQVEQHGATALVNIVPPVNGTSHNQYLGYAVSAGGVVLNNALAAGQSTLLGELGANPQFNGVAAGMIINEVVGSAPSRINGPQEIFGQAADYVLANPNGIHINGGRLINAPQSAFLVGTPEVVDGRLVGLNTFDAPGHLQADGAGLSSDGAVRLIAPRVDINGAMELPGEVTAIIGRNRVSTDGQVLETHQGGEQAIDAQLLGAMKAGRIRVISTREGAGVRMAGAHFIGKAGVDVESAGTLDIGDTQALTGVASTAGDVNFKADGDLTITYARLAGRDVRGRTGGNFRLQPGQHQSEEKSWPEDWDSQFLSIVTERYLVSKQTQKTQVLESVVTARNNLSFEAKGNLDVIAADLKADGDASLTSGGDLRLDAGTQRVDNRIQTYHRKHLWSSKRDEHDTQEQNVPTRLEARNITMTSAGDTQVRGSVVKSSENTTISARKLVVESQVLNGEEDYTEKAGDVLGGLVSKRRADNTGSSQTHAGSRVHADGTLSVTADEVLIKGSQVHGARGAELVSEKGAISLESSHNLVLKHKDESQGAMYGLTGTRDDTRQRTEQAVRSEAGSGTNLTLKAKTDTNITGAQLAAKESVSVRAEGDVNIAPDINRDQLQSQVRDRHFVATAQQTREAEDNKAASKQWAAEVGLEQVDTQASTEAKTVQRPTIEGASVAITAGKTSTLDSADITAHQGKVNIDGKQVVLGSTSDSHSKTQNTRTTGGGIGVTAGMDRSGSYSWGAHEATDIREHRTVAQTTHISSKADTQLTADHGKGHVQNTGANVEAGGVVEVNAASVNNLAARDTEERAEARKASKGTAGLNIETRFLTRPIEKYLNGQDQTVFQKGVEEALEAPSLGIDLAGSHTSRLEETARDTARVSRFEGNTVQAQVHGHLKDEGTVYLAREGAVGIRARSHDASAARNNETSHIKRLDVEGSGRLDTVTSTDVNGRLMASGGSFEEEKTSSAAVPALIDGAQGIAIQLGTDGRYEGTHFNSHGGVTTVQAKGSITLDQANDTQKQTTSTLDGFGWGRLGTSPDKARNIGAGGALTYDQITREASVGRGVDLQGKQAQFLAGGDFRSEGLSAGREQPLEKVRIEAGGKADLGAGVNTSSAQGQRLGGGIQVSTSTAQGSLGGGLGGHFDAGRTQERVREETHSALDTQHLQVIANARSAEAVRLNGVQANASTIDLQAPNGGMLVDAATRTEHKGNLAITAGLGANTLKTGAEDTDTSGLHARLKVKVDNLDSTTHTNASLKADGVNLVSAGDTHLNGVVIDANQVTGQIGGHLQVASRQDRVKGTEVNVDGRISQEHNPQGLLNAVSAVAGPFANKVGNHAAGIRKLDANTSPGISVDVVRTDRTTAAQQAMVSGREGVSLEVAGATHLTGSVIKAAQGQVALADGKVQQRDLSGRDYRSDLSINASNSPTELLSTVLNEATSDKGAQAAQDQHVNAGFYRSGGHDTIEVLKAKIEQASR